MVKFLVKWYITGEWGVLYTSVWIYDATEVVANQLGLKELFYAFCSYLWEQQRRQLTASFFSLSSPFLIRQLMKWPLFSTLPPPMSHCFVSKNRHSLEERARGYTAPFSEAPRICMRPVRVWKTRRKETIFVSQKREKPGGKRTRSVFTLGKVFENWRLKEIHIVKLSTTTKKKRLFLPSREESKSFCPSHTDTPGLDTAILRRKPTM